MQLCIKARCSSPVPVSSKVADLLFLLVLYTWSHPCFLKRFAQLPSCFSNRCTTRPHLLCPYTSPAKPRQRHRVLKTGMARRPYRKVLYQDLRSASQAGHLSGQGLSRRQKCMNGAPSQTSRPSCVTCHRCSTEPCFSFKLRGTVRGTTYEHGNAQAQKLLKQCNHSKRSRPCASCSLLGVLQTNVRQL